MPRQFLMGALYALLALLAPTLYGMGLIAQQLPPNAVLDFEFCGLERNCYVFLQTLSSAQRGWMLASLGLDYLLMALYAPLGWVLLRLLEPAVPARWRRTTRALSWAMLLAGMADAIENALLVRVLAAGADRGLAWPAGLCAAVKFVLLATGLLWWLWFAAAARWRRLRARIPTAAG